MSVGVIGALLACAALQWRLTVRGRRMLHLLQLEHYESRRLFLWLARRRELISRADLLAPLIPLVVGLDAAVAGRGLQELIAFAVLAAVVAVVGRREPARADVKPLVFTDRARRLYTATLAIPFALLLVGIVLGLVLGSDAPPAFAVVAAWFCVNGAARLLALANLLLAPVQRRINGRFEAAARARLAAVAPEVVGITGSYGKTTTKVCVGAVLNETIPTLITPASFNSRLGVIRTINEHLEPAHRAFVVEMGMYRAGDIDELCELVGPRIGVLTAIGPVHLERLGSIEAIADAKAELAQALPRGGHLVVNGDDPRCVEIARRPGVAASTVLYGLENPDARVRAQDIEMADGATSFTLVVDGQSTGVRAGLLGRHNVSNLLAAAAVGHVLGMDLAAIARGLETVEPPEHRLQPLPNPRAGIVVIDDAYNSNPAGAAAALEVLASHPAQRRILVTPGMVELGDEEAALNERFGGQAAAVCDHVILVGPERTKPIDRGLRAAGFDPAAITVVRDIGGATEALAGVTRAGDVILFENDLPDMYSEDGAAAVAA